MNETFRFFGFNLGRALVLIAFGAGLLLAQPVKVKVILTLDTSLGTERAIGLLRPRAFAEADLVGVVTVSSGAPRLLLPLSDDLDALASALQRAGVRAGAGIGGVQINDNRTADLAGAIKLACGQLVQDDRRGRGHAVIVLFGSTDPSFGSQMQSLSSSCLKSFVTWNVSE